MNEAKLELKGVLVELEETRDRLEAAARALEEASVELDVHCVPQAAARAARAAERARQDALA